ncbi:hypothetical protein MTO98_26680 [Mucilaginibacter sp. SMC90]|uniref:hypothetical protein n=1 Tax=Mucilaginibacter sp. SMC90 TaxID=2929803 RepID=UPI001FB2F0F8|nr:hypothetical protein [Mucilaginibacter sp. SMC90]UOE48001.1 hypothetical protein MTO98_26680 [Mucilaginibacter sp. SMC90]
MARIFTSKQKAIDLINNRINELNDFQNFNHVAWKARTVSDLTEIFGPASNQVFNAQRLNFYDIVTNENGKIRENFRQLLQSYIGFIKDHIPEAQVKVVEQIDWEKQYNEMHNIVIQKGHNFDALHKLLENRDSMIDELNAEVEMLKNNVFQTENVTPLRLWRFFINLPWESVTIIIGILGATFALGVWLAHLLKL